MYKMIYNLTMFRNKKLLTAKYGSDFWHKFKKRSCELLHEILQKTPDIGKSVFSFNYKFAPAYIAWYKTFLELGISQNETIKNIWAMNEKMVTTIPKAILHVTGKTYFNSFRKKANEHLIRQNDNKLHPYDWQIEFRNIDVNCFEIDIKTCGIKKLAHDFAADELLPGICRMDYLFASLMKNGFTRTKTLGDGDDCCNCHYEITGKCEWSPEKGFIDRK